MITHLKVFDKNDFSDFFKNDRNFVISVAAEEVTAIITLTEKNCFYTAA
jgi:hypothetical protein